MKLLKSTINNNVCTQIIKRALKRTHRFYNVIGNAVKGITVYIFWGPNMFEKDNMSTFMHLLRN